MSRAATSLGVVCIRYSGCVKGGRLKLTDISLEVICSEDIWAEILNYVGFWYGQPRGSGIARAMQLSLVFWDTRTSRVLTHRPVSIGGSSKLLSSKPVCARPPIRIRRFGRTSAVDPTASYSPPDLAFKFCRCAVVRVIHSLARTMECIHRRLDCSRTLPF
ncbi:hypothetical protein DFH07DRAFT_820865 [Mycena maculata]|uniref:Uncharacterized protein n=1 Tax=Mycena maculata TaxID=230809 RepID=A0AAD7J4C1_9AGAR|nr:hypothetical protein DFH07DRAFT_820865 [Mycena maculata]